MYPHNIPSQKHWNPLQQWRAIIILSNHPETYQNIIMISTPEGLSILGNLEGSKHLPPHLLSYKNCRGYNSTPPPISIIKENTDNPTPSGVDISIIF